MHPRMAAQLKDLYELFIHFMSERAFTYFQKYNFLEPIKSTKQADEKK